MLNEATAFASFAVRDTEAAKGCYGDTLGLDVRDGQMGGIIEIGTDGSPIVVYQKPDHEPAVFTVLNIVVPDIAAAVADLGRSGVASSTTTPATRRPTRTVSCAATGPSIAWFKDPDGNILSVIENPNGSGRPAAPPDERSKQAGRTGEPILPAGRGEASALDDSDRHQPLGRLHERRRGGHDRLDVLVRERCLFGDVPRLRRAKGDTERRHLREDLVRGLRPPGRGPAHAPGRHRAGTSRTSPGCRAPRRRTTRCPSNPGSGQSRRPGPARRPSGGRCRSDRGGSPRPRSCGGRPPPARTARSSCAPRTRPPRHRASSSGSPPRTGARTSIAAQ